MCYAIDTIEMALTKGLGPQAPNPHHELSMPVDPRQTTYFRQARFSTRLPNHYLYAPSHYWLVEVEPQLYRIGLTRFATRMLGDFVEVNFDCPPASRIEVGQPIGTIEGFKAVADVYGAASGEFLGGNPQILTDPELVDRDPYDTGWMYQVRGRPAEEAMDVGAYVRLLQATIDRMLAQQNQQDHKPC